MTRRKRKLSFQMWNQYGALPAHRSNSLDELINRAKRLYPVTKSLYFIKDSTGETVWKLDNNKLVE